MPLPSFESAVSGGGTGSGSTLSWSATVGIHFDRLLLVGIHVVPGATVTGVVWDDAGAKTPLTKIGGILDSGGASVEWWELRNPSPGTKTIKVTMSAAIAFVAGSTTWYDVDQVNPYNAASPQSAAGNASSAQPSLSVTSDVGEIVLDLVGDNEWNPDVLVVGAGQTSNFNINNSPNNTAASSREAGAASVTMSWTGINTAGAPGGSVPWAIIAVSIRGAPERLSQYKSRLSPQQRMAS